MGRFRNTVLLAGATFACHGVAFLNNVLTSKYFGTSVPLDGFWLAMLGATLLMVYVEPLKEAIVVQVKALEMTDRAASQRALSGAINIQLAIAAVLALLAYLTLDQLIEWVTPAGFRGGADGVSAFATLLLPLCILEPINATIEAYLTVERRFFVPKAMMLLGLLGSFAVLIALHAAIAVTVMVIGVYLVSGCRLAGMIATLRQSGFRYSVTLRVGCGRAILVQFFPLLLIQLVAMLVNVVLQRALSGSVEGGLSAYNYAFRVWSLPLTFLVGAIAAILWPEMIENARLDRERLWDEFSFPVRLMLSALSGIGLIFFCQAVPITRVLYERGAFGSQSTELTALCLKTLAVGLPFWGLVMLCGRGLMILGRNRLLTGVAVVQAVVILTGIWIAQQHGWGITILVGSYVGGNVLSGLLFLAFFFLGGGARRYSQIALHVVRIGGAAIAVALCFSAVPDAEALLGGTSKLLIAMRLSVASTVLGGAYVLVLFALGERDVIAFSVRKLKHAILRLPLTRAA